MELDFLCLNSIKIISSEWRSVAYALQPYTRCGQKCASNFSHSSLLPFHFSNLPANQVTVLWLIWFVFLCDGLSAPIYRYFVMCLECAWFWYAVCLIPPSRSPRVSTINGEKLIENISLQAHQNKDVTHEMMVICFILYFFCMSVRRSELFPIPTRALANLLQILSVAFVHSVNVSFSIWNVCCAS